MVHIICTEKMFEKYIKDTELPDDTTVVIKSDDDELLRRVYLDPKEMAWKLHEDFKETERDWKNKKEKQDFIKRMDDPDTILRYFAEREEFGNVTPQREYSEACSLMYKHFPNVLNSNYLIDHDGKEFDRQYNLFKIMVPHNANAKELAKVEKQIKKVLKVQKELHPNLEVYPFGVLEETCSEFGSYDVEIYSDGKCVLNKPYYRGENDFDNLKELLQYMTKHVYYE